MKNAFQYATQVWLTAVLIAPFVSCFWDKEHTQVVNILPMAGMLIIVGAIFSMPSWLALGFAAWAVTNFSTKTVFKKIMLTIVGSALVWLPFGYFFDPFEMGDLHTLVFAYWLVITLGLWFYGLNSRTLSCPWPYPFNLLP